MIRDTAEYCKQRKAFGKPLLDNQVIHYRLAELSTEVELLRSLLYRATSKLLSELFTRSGKETTFNYWCLYARNYRL